MRRAIWVLPLLLLIGVVGFILVKQGDSPSSGDSGDPDGASSPSAAMLEARESLLNSAQDIDLVLRVRIPEGSDADDGDRQEIAAEGTVDLASGNGELVYDFQGLNNAAGFLGHFTEMTTIWIEGTGYLDIFNDGPRWVALVPSDTTGADIERLRDIVLTNPLAVPGFLAADGEGADDRREVAAETLAASDDPFAADVGEALVQLGVEAVEVTIDTDPNDISLSFSYPPLGNPTGEISVVVEYSFAASSDGLNVETPDESDVRQFSEIFGS